MNRKFIVAAITSFVLLPGFALAQQGVSSELDASVRLGLGLDTEPDTDLSFRNYGSRIRWSGSADVDESMQLLSYLEFGFNQDEGVATTRHGWIGVAGDFGTATGGKQYTAFYDAVTSKVDVAYWGSCAFEIGCTRLSSVVKYATRPKDGLQFISSATLTSGNDEVIDGLDVAAKFNRGDVEYGAGISFLGERELQEGGPVSDSGFAAGVSAATELAGGKASATVQFASDDYAGGEDGVIALTGTYSTGQFYGIFGLADADNSPFYLTGGYVKPIVQDRALAYFELGLVEPDLENQDSELQARAVLIFNFGKYSVGGESSS